MKQAFVYWIEDAVDKGRSTMINEAYDELKRRYPAVPSNAVSLEFTRNKQTGKLGIVFTWNDLFQLAPEGFDWRDAEPPPDEEDPYLDRETGVRRLPPVEDYSVEALGLDLLKVLMIIGIISIFSVYILEILTSGGVSRALSSVFGG